MYVIETTGSLKGKDKLVNLLEIEDKSSFGVVPGAVPGTEYSVRVSQTLVSFWDMPNCLHHPSIYRNNSSHLFPVVRCLWYLLLCHNLYRGI